MKINNPSKIDIKIMKYNWNRLAEIVNSHTRKLMSLYEKRQRIKFHNLSGNDKIWYSKSKRKKLIDAVIGLNLLMRCPENNSKWLYPKKK